MAGKPKVFVTRVLPELGLRQIVDGCDAEVWRDPLPPPVEVLRARIADCDGLVSLLTDRIDADLLDRAPRLKVVSNFAVGFNNIDVPACIARGIAVGNTPGVLTDATADMAFCLLIGAAPAGRGPPVYARGPLEDVGAAGPSRAGPCRPDPRRHRHGPHRLRPGQALPRRLGHARAVLRCQQERACRARPGGPACRSRHAGARVGFCVPAHRPQRQHARHDRDRAVPQDETLRGADQHRAARSWIHRRWPRRCVPERFSPRAST